MPKAPRKVKQRAIAAREVELKFLLDPKALDRVARLPVIGRALAKARPAPLLTTYYDTEDRRLEKAGLTMRLRKKGQERLLTVKHVEKAMMARGEWERVVKKDRPHAADYADSPAGAVLGKQEASLVPLFASQVERRAAIVTRNGSRIEVARDRGRITRAGAQIPICEIELELKSGHPRALIALARGMVADAPLHLSFISKAERGQRLAAGEWGKPQKASVPELDPGMTALTAFLAIGRTCLHDFMLNAPALAAPADSEGVHQARVAIRRLRAAMSLFSPVIDHPHFAHVKDELQWLCDLLGGARDLDVAADDPAIPKGSQLASAIAARRDAAHHALSDGLASPRMRLFLLDLAVWLDAASWNAAQRRKLARPVLEVAGELLNARLKRLIERAHDLDELGARKRHRVRIAAKKLRYMCEFFQTLLVEKKARRNYERLRKALEALQDSLGALQDAATFADLLKDVAKGNGKSRPLRDEARHLAKAAKIDEERPLRKAGRAARRLRETKPFWLKLQS